MDGHILNVWPPNGIWSVAVANDANAKYTL